MWCDINIVLSETGRNKLYHASTDIVNMHSVLIHNFIKFHM